MSDNIDSLVNQIHLGNCLDVLKQFSDCSIDSIVCDPPYAMTPKEYKGERQGRGFMGKAWDGEVPSVDIWAECLRVLKHGAFALVMSAPRQDTLMHMIMNLQSAGFELNFSSIYYTYSSGFNKCQNMSKAADKKLGFKREEVPNTGGLAGGTGATVGCFTGHCVSETPVSEQAKVLNGAYSCSLKPAVEIIIVARKPIARKTLIAHGIAYAEDKIKNENSDKQVGGVWAGDCRIPWQSPEDEAHSRGRAGSWAGGDFGCGKPVIVGEDGFTVGNEKGRFPANLLVSDDALTGGEPEGEGSFSRYFDLDRWADDKLSALPENVKKTFPFFVIKKPSQKEKEIGLEDLPEQSKGYGGNDVGLQSNEFRPDGSVRRPVKTKMIHPTVKSLAAMLYCVTLTSRENDIVLDPFSGSGTTCIASALLGRRYVGIDITPEYVELARKRLAVLSQYKQFAEEKFDMRFDSVPEPTVEKAIADVEAVKIVEVLIKEEKKEEPVVSMKELVEDDKKESDLIRSKSGFSLEL